MASRKRSSESLFTVILAFDANLVIAVAKTIAAVVTGSASMVAETAHSWADSGNAVFLLQTGRRAARPRDSSHPSGYGRETYVWSLFAPVGLFTAGAVVSILHGIGQLGADEPETDYIVDCIVLAFAFVGVLLHELTGNAVFDAAGSILVGALPAVVAVVLIDRNRRFLLGEQAPDRVTKAGLAAILKQPEVEKVTCLHLEYVGPERVFLVAAVDLVGNDRESDVADDLYAVEKHLESDEHVAEAVLTLSRRGAPALLLDDSAPPRPDSGHIPTA